MPWIPLIQISLPLPKPLAIILVVQSLSCVQLFVTPWIAACQASLSFTISQSFLKLTSIESMMPSNHLILCSSFSSFSSESALLIRWPNYCSFSFSIVLPVNIQGWFPLGLLVWSPCCPTGSQESSPASQLKSNDSSVLSLLCGPTLISVQGYWIISSL